MLEKLEERIKSENLYLVLSACYVALGIVMIILKGLTIERIGFLAAIVMLAVGAVHILWYFRKKNERDFESDLSVGVTSAAFGAFLLMHPSYTMIVVPFAVGVLILIGAIVKIQYSLYMRQMNVRRWNIPLIFGLVLIGIGIVLLAEPFEENILRYLIACSLMLDGVLNLATNFFIRHRIRQLKKGDGTGVQPAGEVKKDNKQTKQEDVSENRSAAPSGASSGTGKATASQGADASASSAMGTGTSRPAGQNEDAPKADSRPAGPSTAPAGPQSYVAGEGSSSSSQDLFDAGRKQR